MVGKYSSGPVGAKKPLGDELLDEVTAGGSGVGSTRGGGGAGAAAGTGTASGAEAVCDTFSARGTQPPPVCAWARLPTTGNTATTIDNNAERNRPIKSAPCARSG